MLCIDEHVAGGDGTLDWMYQGQGATGHARACAHVREAVGVGIVMSTVATRALKRSPLAGASVAARSQPARARRRLLPRPRPRALRRARSARGPRRRRVITVDHTVPDADRPVGLGQPATRGSATPAA